MFPQKVRRLCTPLLQQKYEAYPLIFRARENIPATCARNPLILRALAGIIPKQVHTEWYRSGYNGPDSKFLEAPAVSSAENVRRTGLCAGSDFTISYRSCVFFLHSSGAGITLEVYGELSERSKVRHSKCRVPKRNLGFESLTLRQKPSHIKAFAHMTGLFFSLKVTSAYMIFGKNSGVPAGLPCVRQSQDIVHYICRGDLGLVIQMAVNIRRRADIAVTQPLLDLLQRHIVCQKQ